MTTTPTTTTPPSQSTPDMVLANVLNRAIDFENAKTRHEMDGRPASGAAALRAEDELRIAVRTYMPRVGL